MLLALLLRVAEPANPSQDKPPLSHSEMDAELRACGFEQFTIRYAEELQSDHVEFRDTRAKDDQLKCLYRIPGWSYYLANWSDENLRLRYYRVGEELRKPAAIAEAHAYFANRSDLGEVPKRKSGQGELDFARELERFCGPEAHGLFTDAYGGVSVRPDWFSTEPAEFEEQTKVLSCIMQAAVLSDFPLGFIGNEKAVTTGIDGREKAPGD